MCGLILVALGCQQMYYKYPCNQINKVRSKNKFYNIKLAQKCKCYKIHACLKVLKKSHLLQYTQIGFYW